MRPCMPLQHIELCTGESLECSVMNTDVKHVFVLTLQRHVHSITMGTAACAVGIVGKTHSGHYKRPGDI